MKDTEPQTTLERAIGIDLSAFWSRAAYLNLIDKVVRIVTCEGGKKGMISRAGIINQTFSYNNEITARYPDDSNAQVLYLGDFFLEQNLSALTNHPCIPLITDILARLRSATLLEFNTKKQTIPVMVETVFLSYPSFISEVHIGILRNCALDAGFSDVSLLSDAEAAAHFTTWRHCMPAGAFLVATLDTSCRFDLVKLTAEGTERKHLEEIPFFGKLAFRYRREIVESNRAGQSAGFGGGSRPAHQGAGGGQPKIDSETEGDGQIGSNLVMPTYNEILQIITPKAEAPDAAGSGQSQPINDRSNLYQGLEKTITECLSEMILQLGWYSDEFGPLDGIIFSGAGWELPQAIRMLRVLWSNHSFIGYFGNRFISPIVCAPALTPAFGAAVAAARNGLSIVNQGYKLTVQVDDNQDRPAPIRGGLKALEPSKKLPPDITVTVNKRTKLTTKLVDGAFTFTEPELNAGVNTLKFTTTDGVGPTFQRELYFDPLPERIRNRLFDSTAFTRLREKLAGYDPDSDPTALQEQDIDALLLWHGLPILYPLVSTGEQLPASITIPKLLLPATLTGASNKKIRVPIYSGDVLVDMVAATLDPSSNPESLTLFCNSTLDAGVTLAVRDKTTTVAYHPIAKSKKNQLPRSGAELAGILAEIVDGMMKLPNPQRDYIAGILRDLSAGLKDAMTKSHFLRCRQILTKVQRLINDWFNTEEDVDSQIAQVEKFLEDKKRSMRFAVEYVLRDLQKLKASEHKKELLSRCQEINAALHLHLAPPHGSASVRAIAFLDWIGPFVVSLKNLPNPQLKNMLSTIDHPLTSAYTLLPDRPEVSLAILLKIANLLKLIRIHSEENKNGILLSLTATS